MGLIAKAMRGVGNTLQQVGKQGLEKQVALDLETEKSKIAEERAKRLAEFQQALGREDAEFKQGLDMQTAAVNGQINQNFKLDQIAATGAEQRRTDSNRANLKDKTYDTALLRAVGDAVDADTALLNAEVKFLQSLAAAGKFEDSQEYKDSVAEIQSLKRRIAKNSQRLSNGSFDKPAESQTGDPGKSSVLKAEDYFK